MPKFELKRLANYDDDSLLAELRRVASLISNPFVTQHLFNQHAKCSSDAIRKRFGSWETVLALAGLVKRFSGGVGGRGRMRQVFTDSELVVELQRIAAALGS